MKCPIDDTELAMAERQGIEVDYCPKCRGVWLDRGELDKIIERSGDVPVAPQVSERPRSSDAKYRDDRSDRHESKYRDDRTDRYHDDRQYGSQKHHKKKSLLSELFDF